MIVAVTGASGFIGGAVCAAALAQGWTVHAFGRRPRPGRPPAAVPYHRWDITAPAAGPMPQVDAVIHCAGSTAHRGPERALWAVHMAGTLHVLEAFPEARFIHVSTAEVYDPFTPTVMAAESQAPVDRYRNAYGDSKAAAERLLLSLAPDRAVILRPHAVYGPGDTTLLPRLLGLVRGRRLFAVGDGRQRLSLTSVRNLAQACLLAAAGPVRSGVYNIADAEPVTLDEALRALLRERRIPAEPCYLPRRLAEPLAGAVEALCRAAGRVPAVTRYAVAHLAVERTLDITAARKDLDYRPEPTSFAGAATW